jgi:NADH-quinone oxidoreductase subunit N
VTSLVWLLLPELILGGTACALFVIGLSRRASMRRLTAAIALAALMLVFVIQWFRVGGEGGETRFDSYGGFVQGAPAPYGTVRAAEFTQYIKLIASGVGILLMLLAWPTREDGTGNSALDFGSDAGEFYALMLLSLTGVLLVAGANDIMLLFLGLELASIPTYIMVSLSRPLPVAQEAGVKYFFLGAMSAAVMLFGFSYLYGTTGSTNLLEIMQKFHPPAQAGNMALDQPARLTPWQTLAVLMLLAGFAFKIAAVPLHFYAGDVYQGAATPVTAFLSFVPKTAGFVALIKLLYTVGGPWWALPEPLVKANGTGLLWILAVLTMTVGNVLGLLQYNVKRVLAYSSIAHTGYMLVGLAALGGLAGTQRSEAIRGVLFYLAAYGIMNAGAFGVLMLLNARDGRGSAETFEDLAGQGKRHVGLGLAMAVCCFSLIGIPLTVGFLGKLLIIKPALVAAATAPRLAAGQGPNPVRTAMVWLVVITMINAAISAAYYLRIVATMFLRTEESAGGLSLPRDAAGRDRDRDPGGVYVSTSTSPSPLSGVTWPITTAVVLSVVGTLVFGMVPPVSDLLGARAQQATELEGTPPQPPRGSTGASGATAAR